jgi:hypothetical protein
MQYNLETDIEYILLHSEYIKKKCQNRDYAENLYRTLCNTKWIAKDSFTLLKNKPWSCSWRYAAIMVGDIVSTSEELSDYLDWYLVGGEDEVDTEVQRDLNNLGFIIHFG